MNTRTIITSLTLILLAICLTSLPAFAETAPIVPETKPKLGDWKPQEPRQEYVVRVVVFTATGTKPAEDTIHSLLSESNYTLGIDSDSKDFAKQMHSLFPDYSFSVVTSVDKVCSNQEPCSFTYGPQPDDPTKNTLTAEFGLKVRADGGITLTYYISQYCIDPLNSLVSQDGKTLIPNEQTQSLYSKRILKPGEVTLTGGFSSEQHDVTFIALSVTPHKPELKAK